MGKVLSEITDELRGFIEAQPMFFVATAPLAGGGHINVSPRVWAKAKGADGIGEYRAQTRSIDGLPAPFPDAPEQLP